MSLFDFVVLVLLLGQLSMTAALFGKVCTPSAEERTDAKVERELERERGSIDEGFENIMRYSVNGKTGFEDNYTG